MDNRPATILSQLLTKPPIVILIKSKELAETCISDVIKGSYKSHGINL